MISLIKNYTRASFLNSRLHVEYQMNERMKWIEQNEPETIKTAGENIAQIVGNFENEFRPEPVSKKINLVKSPIYKVKPKNLVNLDEELGGEEYYLAEAAGTGHVEIPST